MVHAYSLSTQRGRSLRIAVSLRPALLDYAVSSRPARVPWGESLKTNKNGRGRNKRMKEGKNKGRNIRLGFSKRKHSIWNTTLLHLLKSDGER